MTVRELKTNNMEGIGEYQEQSGVGAFALQSGNSSSLPFKEMGSSPANFGEVAAQVVGPQPTMMKNQSNVAEQNTSEVPQHGPEAHMKGKMGGKMWGGVGGTAGGQDAFEAMSKEDFRGMERGARKEYMGGLNKKDKRAQMQSLMPKMFGGGGGGGGIFGGMFG
jgi:hypothetical protein